MATKKKDATPLSPIEQILANESVNAKDNKSVISCTCKNGETIKLEVTPTLTFEEMHDFVTTVVESVFVDDVFSPIVKPFIINNMIVRHYMKSNVAIGDSMAVELAYNVDLLNLINDTISSRQYYDIMNAIESGIEFKKQQLLSNERKLLNESIANCERLADEVTKCIDAFKLIADQFSGIDPAEALDTYKKLVNMDKQDFVDNVLEFKQQKE